MNSPVLRAISWQEYNSFGVFRGSVYSTWALPESVCKFDWEAYETNIDLDSGRNSVIWKLVSATILKYSNRWWRQGCFRGSCAETKRSLNVLIKLAKWLQTFIAVENGCFDAYVDTYLRKIYHWCIEKGGVEYRKIAKLGLEVECDSDGKKKCRELNYRMM